MPDPVNQSTPSSEKTQTPLVTTEFKEPVITLPPSEVEVNENGELVRGAPPQTEEELFDTGIDMDAFKKGEITPKKKESETETKPDDKKEEVKSSETPPIVTPKKPVSTERDLSFADEADRPLFKQMSNDAFNRLSKLYTDHKQKDTDLIKLRAENEELKRKTVEPDVTLLNEEGYTLSPEYRALGNKYNIAKYISDHWSVQLGNIRAGKQWTALTYDKDGNIRETEPQAASDEAEIKVQRALIQTTAQLGKVETELEGFTEKFKQKYGGIKEFVSNVIKQYFPGYDDPKHATAKIQSIIEENMHPALKGDPMMPLFKAMGASNAMLRAEVQQLHDEINKLKGIKKDANAAPPPGSSIKEAGGAPQVKVVTMDDFHRERQNR